MLSLSQVQTHESSWDPNTAQVTLNTRLDARLVPHGSGMRLDYGHVVVLDNFIDEPQRQALLDLLTKPEWEHSEGPPTDKWERETADGAGLPKTWGLKDSVLQKLAKGDMPAMQEVHTRLAKLYPDFTIAHMPSDMIQHRTAAASDNDDVVPGSPGPSQVADTSLNNALRHGDLRLPQIDATLQSSQCQTESGSHQAQPPSRSGSDDESVAEPSVDCNQFVGNAAVYGDCYTWHVDADPSAFPASPWVDTFGHYCNGDPGKHYWLLCWCVQWVPDMRAMLAVRSACLMHGMVVFSLEIHYEVTMSPVLHLFCYLPVPCMKRQNRAVTTCE